MGVEMEKHWWRRKFWKKSEGWKEVKEGRKRKPPRRSSSITEFFLFIPILVTAVYRD
jgi:hypothetical protein